MSKKDIYGGNFFPPDPNDSIYNILAAGGNMVVGYGLKWASRKIAGVMGLSEVSAEKQIALNRSRLLLQKQQADFEATKISREKQIRILDLKIQEKELYITERKHLYLAIMFLALSLALFACNPQEAEPSETTPPPGDETSAAPLDETGYEGLGLTEDEIRMLEERGIANVESAEVASKIAGFKVAAPAYVPDGFKPGKFSIQISGGGMPEGISPKFNNTKVERVYSHEDGKTMILLIQSPQQLSVGGAEPAEICDQTGERKFSPADPTKGQLYDKLTFGWEKDGFYFALTGMLSEALSEAEMEQMVCSISTE